MTVDLLGKIIMTGFEFGYFANSTTMPNESKYTLFNTSTGSQPMLLQTQIGYVVIKYVFPGIVVCGTLGNIMSFIVLLRRRMRKRSMYLYLALLAWADTGVLYLSAFKTWLRVTTGFELLHQSAASCKLVMLFLLFCLDLSAWLIVLITAERFAVVWFPFRASYMFSLKRGLILMTVTMILSLTYNLHVLWTIHLVKHSPKHTYCSGLKNDFFMEQVFNPLNLAVYSIVPFIIVVCLNAANLYKVVHPFRSHSPGVDSTMVRHTPGNSPSHQKTSSLLMTVSFAWLVLTCPFALWSLVPHDHTDARHKANTFLAKIICFIFMYLNHSINFFLYCITGRKFRKELTSLIQWLKPGSSSSRPAATRRTRFTASLSGTTQDRYSAIKLDEWSTAVQQRL